MPYTGSVPISRSANGLLNLTKGTNTMEYVTGTPEEVVAYRKLTETPAVPTAVQDTEPAQAQDPEVETEDPAEDTPEEESPGHAAIARRERLVRYVLFSRSLYGNSTSPTETFRMETLLNRAETELGLIARVGKSRSTTWGDGYTDYIRLCSPGVRRSGAVVYLRPWAGSLHLRLQRPDVWDLLGKDTRIVPRNIDPGNPHGITVELIDDDSIDLALELTKRAIAKVGT